MLRVNQKQMFIVLYLLTKYILPRNDDFLLSAILVTFFLPFIIALLTALRNTWRWFVYGEDVQCGDCWFIYWPRVADEELDMGILILHFNLLSSDYRGEVDCWSLILGCRWQTEFITLHFFLCWCLAFFLFIVWML